MCLYVCVSVCLTACMSQKLHIQISPNLLYMLRMAVALFFSNDSAIRYVLPVCGWRHVFKQHVALAGRNRTGPPCSVGRPTTHAPGGRPARPPAALQTTDDRRQRAKQYWPIRRASNNRANGPKSKTTRMFRRFVQMAASGAKSAVSNCTLFDLVVCSPAIVNPQRPFMSHTLIRVSEERLKWLCIEYGATEPA